MGLLKNANKGVLRQILDPKVAKYAAEPTADAQDILPIAEEELLPRFLRRGPVLGLDRHIEY
jgi:hypothetical protein